MKTLLIIDAGLGQARAYMAKTLLGAAAPKAHLELIDNPNDAELFSGRRCLLTAR